MTTKKQVEYIPNPGGAALVLLHYRDLLDDRIDLSDSIEAAFGYDGLGLLVVEGVPNFAKLRKDLLPLAHKFANLPDEIKKKTVHEESFYSFGWSHGKELLEGKPDYSKGSYYNNPQYDVPFDDPELIKKYPSFCHPNIWPKEDLPELEPAFKAMGQCIVNVGLLLARHCDKYVKKVLPTYKDFRLYNIIKESRTCKARLLHYFPLQDANGHHTFVDEKEDPYSSWCGWHNDHGSLTGLVPAMFINSVGKEVPNPDPAAGLYIRSRNGALVRAVIPPDHLAFQIGETAQIHSGGVLQATPHCVRAAQGPKAIGISRESYAVFMEPMWSEPMDIPPGANVDNVLRGSSSKYLPKGVPLLGKRWRPQDPPIDFGQFTEITLKSYY
jgi:isopenicillin N synthase-like dioxygenase